MKERPILFSAPMVRSLLDGSKTQTRRVVKAAITMGRDSILAPHRGKKYAPVYLLPEDAAEAVSCCPYGQPGDRLWVREAWRVIDVADCFAPREITAAHRIWFDADGPKEPPAGRYRPGMFMPRWASRITLEVTGVRVERLQAISEADAKAEGVTPKWEPGCSGRLMEAIGGFSHRPAASAYADLWEQINGPDSWAANPYVWVVEFRNLA